MSDEGNEPEAMISEVNSIRPRLRDYIMAHFPVAREQQLSDDDSLLQSGAVDSLGILDVVLFLEQEFDLTLGGEDVQPEHFESITTLARLVESKLC